jgi:small-conductance mechanosensitive channel
LGTTTAALDSVALMLGTTRISLLLVFKAVLIIAILLWVALAVARLISMRLQRLAGLSPSVQALAGNLLKIVLIALAFLIGLNTVGIDLTALAVFSGAIGVGLGFGLQKIVSNFVSGIILLLEHSIKPGDVIEVGHAYGTVTSLGARYATVHGRDSKEYLIPNETLITNQVTNWSYSSPMLRLDVRFGVGYGSDLRQVRRLATEAAQATRRVITSSPRSATSPNSATTPCRCCCGSGSRTRPTASRTSLARFTWSCGTDSASTGSSCPRHSGKLGYENRRPPFSVRRNSRPPGRSNCHHHGRKFVSRSAPIRASAPPALHGSELPLQLAQSDCPAVAHPAHFLDAVVPQSVDELSVH